jgi:DNA-binding winged helix-turn-helix (wHTH) protein/tetratricopeptide (TPR) repeat protein
VLSVSDDGPRFFEFGPFRLDAAQRVLLRDGRAIALQPKAMDILLLLVRNPGRLITKEELLSGIWPKLVVEESNLSQNIFLLRKALGDGDGGHRYIVTLPRRGYKFVEPVSIPQGEAAAVVANPPTLPSDTMGVTEDAPPQHAPSRIQTPFLGAAILGAAIALVVIALAGSAYFRHSPLVKERSRVLVTGITNLTNDPAFDTVPGNVLEIGLSQSPFLSLIPPQQISKTLQLMERPVDAKLSAELGREICLRNQGKAVLSGAIAAFGSRYVVTLDATDCSTGERIVQSKSEAVRKEDVPHALDGLTTSMRANLGESLASVRQFDVPIEQATTGSFEALRAYSVGEQARLKGDNAAAVPLFKQAIELDPSFALAYGELAAAYVGLRHPELARSHYQKAFELKDRASENERLWISAEYFKYVGNAIEAANSYQTLAKLYPRDGRPWESLGDMYTRLARYADAVDAAKEGLRLNPDDSRAYVILARAYKRSNRFIEANAIGRQAEDKGLDGWPMRCLLYEVAFALGDAQKMSEQVAKETGKPSEDWMVLYEAWGAATAGRIKESRVLFEQAIALTETSGEQDHAATTSEFYTDYVQMLGLYGLTQEARQLIAKAPGLETNDDAPFALALAGDFGRAAALERELGKQYPDSTLVNNMTRPKAQAAIALGQLRPQDAIVALQPAQRLKLQTFDVPYLLGQAYLQVNAPIQAAAEFGAILENRGVDALSPSYALAYLGLARALRMQGNIQKSRAAYEHLFAFWKNAEPDNPVLVRAREEYSVLGK